MNGPVPTTPDGFQLPDASIWTCPYAGSDHADCTEMREHELKTRAHPRCEGAFHTCFFYHAFRNADRHRAAAAADPDRYHSHPGHITLIGEDEIERAA